VGDRPGRSTGALHRFLESRLRPVSTLVLLLVVSSAVAVGFLPGSGTAPPPSEFGYFVEDFTVTTIEGVAVSLSRELAQGRVVLLDFMFVNCEACRISMPHLVALRNAFGPDVLTMISIDLVPTETEGMLAAFRDEFGATWHFAFDRTGELQLEYKVEIFPSLMIIKPSGKVAFAAPGVTESALLISAVRAVAR